LIARISLWDKTPFTLIVESDVAMPFSAMDKWPFVWLEVGENTHCDFKAIEELDEETDKLIRRINRCMLDINFRREPIYLPDERLEEADHIKYKIALQRIPSLQLLRAMYIGRVIHSSPEQWKSDVIELLRFNLTTQDNAIKWKKQ
jgi:hypothetical protein